MYRTRCMRKKLSRITQKSLQKQRQASAKSKLYSKQLRQTQKLAAQIKSGKFDTKYSQRQRSATMQFKSPKPHVQSRHKRPTSQFKSPGRKSAATQFKSPGPRVQYRTKRSRSQFKLPVPIMRSSISAPGAHAMSSSLMTMPAELQTIIEQPTLPLPTINVQTQASPQSAQALTQSSPTDLPVDETTKSTSTGIDYRLVWIMAVACGLSTGNLIYAQPLLAQMGRSFLVSANAIGLTATLAQPGYALGLIFIVPLGEKYNQRRLIVLLRAA